MPALAGAPDWTYEACRQETYTYPPCGTPKCTGTIRTITQDRARKCGACLASHRVGEDGGQ